MNCPLEIWDKILRFTFTDVKSFLPLSQVCTTFRSLLSSYSLKLEQDYLTMPPFLQQVTNFVKVSLPCELFLNSKVKRVEISSILSKRNITISSAHELEELYICKVHANVTIVSPKIKRLVLGSGDYNLTIHSIVDEVHFLCKNSRVENILRMVSKEVRKIASEERCSNFCSLPEVSFPKLQSLEGFILLQSFYSLCPKLERVKTCLYSYSHYGKANILSFPSYNKLLDVYLNHKMNFSVYETVIFLDRIDMEKEINLPPLHNKLPLVVFIEEKNEVLLRAFSILKEKYKLAQLKFSAWE